MDSDIDAMILHGIVINLVYENYGEQLIKKENGTIMYVDRNFTGNSDNFIGIDIY